MNRKVKVKFLKEFTCSTFGNVYLGMVRTTTMRDINKYLKLAYCELVEDKPAKKVDAKKEALEVKKEKVEDNGDSKPKRRKKSSKNRSK